MKTTAIIVAAGSSSRMGFDKTFAVLNGKPVLLYSLEAFQESESVDEIIVITQTENHGKVRAFNIPKVVNVAEGGENRMQSVLNGLELLKSSKGFIAIHDGARPMITPDLIDEVVNAAKVHGAAIPAVPVKDTIKEIDGGRIISTPNRELLYSAQTPQVFGLALYRQAVACCVNASVTDDCMLVERLGSGLGSVKIHVVEGRYSNIKITTIEDLEIAGALLYGTN